MAFFIGDPSAPTRFGTDVANTADETGLFLKIWGGEIFAAFTEAVITLDKHFVREIKSGKSAQFPRTWKVNAHYHTAGQEMLGQDTDETERVITIDGLLVSHVGIYDLDDAMSHFSVRGEYTSELGRALARVTDQNVMRAVLLTARDSSTLGGGSQTTSPFPAGQVITSADVAETTISATNGQAWFEVMRALRVAAKNDSVPSSEQVWLAVPPETFDATAFGNAANSTANPFLFQNRDNMFSQSGDATLRLRNVTMIETELLPQTDESADTNIKAKYRGDYTATLAAAWGRTGVGTVRLIGMGLETARDVRRQEDFIVAKMAVGHGALRNELTWEVTA